VKCPRCGWVHGYTNNTREAARESYPKAFKPWTPAEDSRLNELVLANTDILTISQTLQRQPGAVTKRIDLLRLKFPEPAKPTEIAKPAVPEQTYLS
jgi:hypothetical protein